MWPLAARPTTCWTPAPHTVRTDLGGDSAGNWSANVRDDFPVIVAGRFTWMSASFTLKGLLKMLTWPAGLVGDIYVDGNLIAPQAATAQLFTTPQVAHTVEARNVVDPAANGRYRFDDLSVSATTFSGSTRFVYLRPAKVWLQGTLSVLCVIISQDRRRRRGMPGESEWRRDRPGAGRRAGGL